MVGKWKGVIIQYAEILEDFSTFRSIVDEEMVKGTGGSVRALAVALGRIAAGVAAMVTIIVVTEHLGLFVTRDIATVGQLLYRYGPNHRQPVRS